MVPSVCEKILRQCEENFAQLCLVTKNRSVDEIRKKNIAPDIILAENRVQELEEKFSYFSTIQNSVHFIGTLQKNKVRKAVQMCDVIQTVDSVSLLERIDRIAREEGKVQRVFLNINISCDENKSGVLPENISRFFTEVLQKNFQNIMVEGLFTILKKGLSDSEISLFYAQMRKIFKQQKEIFGGNFTQISMGMSADYEIALEEGATMVRVGSMIFNEG